MGWDQNGSLSAEEWSRLWGEPEHEQMGENYVLPKFYPGPRVRCPNCGFWQGNEAVIDTYRWCMRCCTVLQDPRTLYWDEPLGMGDLRVVAASYGHKKDPRLAFDVRRLLQARVGVSDRLEITCTEDLTAWLGNPCPGESKTLRIRYMFLSGRARGRRREVWLQESKFDVTEFMQGRVDLAGGGYLFLSKKEPLVDLFGDPCPGRDKVVMLHYEILGTEGKAEAQECDGRLVTPISISCTPILAPLIVIESAVYGQTREGIDQRLTVIQRELSDLLALQNRKDMGMPVSRDQNKRLRRLRSLIADLEYLQRVTPRHIDVTARMQGRVERLGGGVLELVALNEDLNRFCGGNPLPGEKKELRVRYFVVGHDSEQLTSLEETTTSGYPRNFILQRKGEVIVQVTDDRMERGVLETDVLIESPKVLPVIEILSASYGHPRNPTKTYDICTKLRGMIDKQGGESLRIGCGDDLKKMFDDPCRGVRKKIKITYVARGLHGRVRVKESNRRLVADVIVGYYSRENFSHSELLAKRYRDAAASNAVKANTHDAHHGSTNASSFHCNYQLPGESDDSGDDDVAQGPLADPMAISVFDTSLTCRGSDIPSFDTKIVNGNLPSAAAIARRQTKRERRDAHQVSIRRKIEEKEAERRRMSAEIDRRNREAARTLAASEAEARGRLIALRQADAVNENGLLKVVSPLMKRTLLRLRERASNAATGVATRSRRKNDDTVQTVGDGGDPTVVLGIVANQPSPNTGAGEESTGNSRRHDVTYFPNVSSIKNSVNIARVTGEGEDVVIQRGNSTNAAAGDRRQSGESWGKKMNYLPTHKSKASMDQTEIAAPAREGHGKERTLVSHKVSHFDDEQRRSMHRRSSIRFADEAAVPVAGDDGMTTAGKDIYLADKRDAIARENRAFRKISTMREERESHERREETYSPEGKHADGPTVSSGTQEYLDVEKRLQTLRRSGHQNGHEKLHLTQDRSREQPQNTVGSTEQQIPRDSEVAVFTRSPKGADYTTTGNSPPEGNTENAKLCNDEGEIVPSIADVRESSLNADPPARIYTGAPAAHALFPASRQSGSRDVTNTKEPRAVFVHRASLLEAGKVAMAMGAGHRGSFGSSCAGGVGGGEDGQPFAGERRRPSKPGVGSLPIPS